jgi:hypothetical protein
MVKKTRPKAAARIPRLEFRFSWVYDHENKMRFTDPMYPSGDDIRKYLEVASDAWKPRGRALLGSIARISGLPWQEESIVCYLVGRAVPMSDPLTMPVYDKQPDIFLEKLCYQLIERHIMHPRNLVKKSGFWESMFRSLTGDGVKVSYMVPVNAMFREIISKRFPVSGASERSLVSTNLDYKRAWEIVDDLGHSNIIERFRRGEWD